MPNSLKCRLKKLEYQGLLSEKDLSRIYTDNDVIAELEKIREEIEVEYWDDFDGNTVIADNQIDEIFNKHIAELKGEQK